LGEQALFKDIILDVGECEASEFTVSYWKVDPGAAVREGDELLVLESVEDKTALSVVCHHTGTLVEVLVGEEATVTPGDGLGRIETA
jgi:pyruvate/2-oxoglutarate dehydrogenase complex dihydrolipoamide acyltransferase (E2) component